MARMILNIGCALVLLGTIAFTQQTPDPATGMTTAAIKFLDTLSDEQERAARFPFDGEDRFDWHFIPRERKGVALKTMSEEQQAAGDEDRQVDRRPGCGFTDVHVSPVGSTRPGGGHTPLGRGADAAEHRRVGDRDLIAPLDHPVGDRADMAARRHVGA